MVYDKEFRMLHPLTDEGKRAYDELLQREADRILFRHCHPFRYFMRWLAGLFE